MHPAHWVAIELSCAALIIGLAVGLQVSEYGPTQFKATFSEALVAAGMVRHELAERISLTGSWDAPDEAASRTPAQTVSVDPRQSIDAAEQDVKRRGAALIDRGSGRTRVLRLGSSTVLLVRYGGWAGTGAVSFRPAVPDVERPTTVMLHCGPGKPPRGWVAPPELVPSNLPVSLQPWMCRARRQQSS